ncbi:MAG: four helix bundle protein [Verrucomicrobia bacterium]|nr:four helix bundle protein [Verrucomicrobiota bacterium]MBU1908807.1 four helix bundle protein [Verrucomicrobiota bacterium]
MKPQLSHEKLDVYQLELEFIRWSAALLNDVKGCDGIRTAEVRDQLDRASLSMLLNTAEGNGRRRMHMRSKFFDDARGSATECAACLDALVAKSIVPENRIVEGKALLASIAAMLTKLVEYFSATRFVREAGAEYGQGPCFESEKEGEKERDKKGKKGGTP